MHQEAILGTNYLCKPRQYSQQAPKLPAKQAKNNGKSSFALAIVQYTTDIFQVVSRLMRPLDRRLMAFLP